MTTTTTTPKSGRRWGRFALHYVEMIIAMFVGMIGLGMLRSAVGLGISPPSSRSSGTS